MAEIIGHVDPRNRPIVALSLVDQEDSVPAVVDTGFNGELLISETDFHRFRCESLGLEAHVEFADGERRTITVARTRILWFGRAQEVRVWITPADRRRAAVPTSLQHSLGLVC